MSLLGSGEMRDIAEAGDGGVKLLHGGVRPGGAMPSGVCMMVV